MCFQKRGGLEIAVRDGFALQIKKMAKEAKKKREETAKVKRQQFVTIHGRRPSFNGCALRLQTPWQLLP
jgi:hypothetical protein